MPARWFGVNFFKLFCFFSCGFFFLSIGCKGKSPSRSADLVLFTYDSFLGKHGLGTLILPLFEKRCGCKVQAIAAGEAGHLLTRLELEARTSRPRAQLVIGLDTALASRAQRWIDTIEGQHERSLVSQKLKLRAFKVPDGFIPFQYGVLGWMADIDALKKINWVPPHELRDLVSTERKKIILLEDPRTSAPGLAFLLYLRDVMGEQQWDFWKKLRHQWPTLTPSWSAAYGMFLKEDAPLVWSYTTSQAYHEEHGDARRRYRALIFDDGNPLQVEGIGIIKNSIRNPAMRARVSEFIEWMLSPEVQAKIPQSNWMYPVNEQVPLPSSFKNIPLPKKSWIPSAEGTEELLKKWEQNLYR